jgi:hypothetical protein
VKAARGFYWAFIATVLAMLFATMMFTSDDVHENVAMEQSHVSVAVDQRSAAANDSSRKPTNKPAKP